jgi:hypothetical protein
MADIGTLIGALLITFVVSRLLRRFAFRKVTGARKVLAPNIGALIVASIIGAFGMADGGSPAFGRAFLTYLLPVVIWTVVDAVREKQSATSTQPQPPASI